jgi:hypothetical protein
VVAFLSFSSSIVRTLGKHQFLQIFVGPLLIVEVEQEIGFTAFSIVVI